MAAPTFRESGKPRPGKYANKTGAGTVISPPGAGNAIVIYDIVWLDAGDTSNYARFREQAAAEDDGEMIMFMNRRLGMNLTSPIQVSENMGVYMDGGNGTITYEIISI